MRVNRILLLGAVLLGVIVVFALVLAGWSAQPANTDGAGGAASFSAAQATQIDHALATAAARGKVALPPTISGMVANAQGPIPNALVQVQGSPNRTTTDANGTFTLNEISGTNPITVTAWAAGDYIGWRMLDPNAPDWNPTRIIIQLEPHPTADNYQFMGFSQDGVTGAKSCGICHREYDEWKADAHSQSSQNVHFVTMYLGTDVQGHEGQPIQYNLQGKPLPPDPSLPYYGPGFRLDNPERAGSCAACHAPYAARISNEKNCSWMGCHSSVTVEHSNGMLQPGVFATSSTERAQDGVSCEFCHQIGDVLLNDSTQLPNSDRPGILSLRMVRPPDGGNLFFGTMVDVTRKDSYSPLLSESKFCATCHYGVLGGVVGMDTMTGGTLVYGSYSEWLNSPYSNPKTGKTCQDCHMPKANANYTAFPDHGGIVRDFFDFHSHQMRGITEPDLLKSAVTMKSDAAHNQNALAVHVSITNDKTGHKVPTDTPLRQMILIVQAFDANGNVLTLEQGPVNPTWAGNYAQVPGKTFSQVLQDKMTGEYPTAAFWRQTNVIQDTRLAPLATDAKTWSFRLPAGQTARVHVQLVYRRALQTLSQQKGWNDPDMVMAEDTLSVNQ